MLPRGSTSPSHPRAFTQVQPSTSSCSCRPFLPYSLEVLALPNSKPWSLDHVCGSPQGGRTVLRQVEGAQGRRARRPKGRMPVTPSLVLGLRQCHSETLWASLGLGSSGSETQSAPSEGILSRNDLCSSDSKRQRNQWARSCLHRAALPGIRCFRENAMGDTGRLPRGHMGEAKSEEQRDGSVGLW